MPNLQIILGALCTSATLAAPVSYYWGSAPVAAAAISPILVDQAISVQSPIGLQDEPSALPLVAAASPVLLGQDSHRQRRQITPHINSEKSTEALASPEFHTSHRIPEHIAANLRQAEEHSFQTAHQIPSHPPPVIVAMHPKVRTTSATPTSFAAAVTTTTSSTTKGHRHRRDDAAVEATDSAHHHEHVAGLVFPVPVGQIVKHSLAAPEIHQQYVEM